MKKYLEKRIVYLTAQEYQTQGLMDTLIEGSLDYSINYNLLKELQTRRIEAEETIAYCIENRPPILVDVVGCTKIIKGLLANIEFDSNPDKKYSQACNIAHDALLQLEILQKK